MFRHQASEGHCAHPARRFRDFFASNLYDVNDTRAGTTLWESHYRTSAVLELQMSGNGVNQALEKAVPAISIFRYFRDSCAWANDFRNATHATLTKCERND
jgi:hypothetical protein